MNMFFKYILYFLFCVQCVQLTKLGALHDGLAGLNAPPIGCPEKLKSYILRSTTLYIIQLWSLSHHKKGNLEIYKGKYWIFTFSRFYRLKKLFSISVDFPISIRRPRWVYRHLTCLRCPKISFLGIHPIFGIFSHFGAFWVIKNI